MPKIRNKNSGNINKSGALTQTYKSYFKEDREKYSFFKKEVNHRSLGSNNENIFFDDSKSIMFVEKDLNPTLSIDPNHETKLLSTPNTFPDESIVQTSVLRDKDYYNFSIEENYTENDYNILKEGFNDSAVIDKKENIAINFERNQYSPIHLSSGYSGHSGSDITDNTVNIYYNPVANFIKPTNSHTAYLSQIDNITCDYLNDATHNMYADFNTFCLSGDYAIPFSGLTYYSQNFADRQDNITNYNMPIQDFGFPYSAKFRPKEKHIINANKYISRPFVIEKVVLKTNISNWSIADINTQSPCINFVNFFILNQRGKLNSNALDQQRIVKRYDTDSSDFEEHIVDNTYDDESYTQKWTNFSVQKTNNDWEKQNIVVENISYNNPVKASQRELITNISITNYSRDDLGFLTTEEYLDHDTDLLINKTGITKQTVNSGVECIYENLNVDITSNVKNYKHNKFLPRFSKFNLYPKKNYSTRTNFEKRSERSLKTEHNSFDSELKGNGDFYNQIVEYYDPSKSSNSNSNEYVLYPEDELIFGVNLASSYDPGAGDAKNYNSLYGRDVVHINGDINFTLVGYYLQSGEEKIISHKNHYENANMKRIGYSFSEVVDDFGLPSGYLLKGSYYDHQSSTATAGSNFSSLVNYVSGRNGNGFTGNLISLPNTVYLTIGRNSPLENYEIDGLRYKENEQDTDYKFIKQYFNLNKFGQPAFKINFNRYIQHEDMDLNNIINYFIDKKYKKGLFIEKSLSAGDTFNSYNTTQRASLTDVQIAFKEGEGI